MLMIRNKEHYFFISFFLCKAYLFLCVGRFIYLEDLMRFLPEHEALKTLNAVEGSTESGRISKASLKSWVVCHCIASSYITF